MIESQKCMVKLDHFMQLHTILYNILLYLLDYAIYICKLANLIPLNCPPFLHADMLFTFYLAATLDKCHRLNENFTRMYINHLYDYQSCINTLFQFISINIKQFTQTGSIKHHFFFFFGFLILRLAGGIGILSPSSVGSVILIIFLTMVSPLAVSRISLILSSEILGVKLIKMVLR